MEVAAAMDRDHILDKVPTYDDAITKAKVIRQPDHKSRFNTAASRQEIDLVGAGGK
jgi:hypothetical protein